MAASEKRSLPEQTLFRFSYAVGLCHGAERIRAGIDQDAEPQLSFLPVFLLIGFALENVLAAFLIGSDHAIPGDYKSHDLERALRACTEKQPPLVLRKPARDFIGLMSPHHQSFIFRYPEKMTEVSLPQVDEACSITAEVFRDVHLVLKMRGFDIPEETEKL